MGRVQKSTTSLVSPTQSHESIRTAIRHDAASGNKSNKPNRKFQLALQGLNRQHNRPKPRQDTKPEPKQEPKPVSQLEATTRLSFTQGPRAQSQAETSKISFIRNSPKPSPPATPESDSSRVSSRRPSGYRASPLGQPPSPQPNLSFVRVAKPESENPRLLRENKDRPAVAANAHFMRTISNIGIQNTRGSRTTTPSTRPDCLKLKSKASPLAKPKSPLATATSSEATPPQPSPQAIEPKVEEPKPAMSILDRLGTSKRRRSPSPVPETKRDKMAPQPQQKRNSQNSSRLLGTKRRRSPSPTQEVKREKPAPQPQSKRNSQISSRLGPLSHEPQHSFPASQSVRSRLGHHDSNPARYGNHGHSSQAFRPPQPGSHYAPQQHHQEQHREYQQHQQHQEFKQQYQQSQEYHQHPEYLQHHEYQQHQEYSEYPVHMSQAHPAYPQQAGYPMPSQQQHFPANGYYMPKAYTPRRCQYFPRCARADCKFFHPRLDCPNGADCLDEDCLFVHPDDKKPVMCIFDATCNRVDCKFDHAHRRFAVGDPDRYVPIKCEGECSGRECPFLHPNDKLPHTNTLCIFAARCNRPPCSYYHMSTYRKKPAKKATTISELMAAYKKTVLDNEDSDDDDF